MGVGHRALLSPELIGRSAVIEVLRAAFVDAQAGRGGFVVLRGAAGMGKSRLLATALGDATAGGMARLRGRCVPSPAAVPYRPLIEAFATHFRTADPPESVRLDGLRGHLARFVPQWAGAENQSAHESPVIVAEAIVRMLGALAGRSGCVVGLEDIHWADSESLAALDYLADATPATSVLCVCTTRPDGAARELVDRLDRRGAVTVIDIEPLSGDDVDRMIGACLSTTSPPPELRTFVREHSDGSPFLVEELLAGVATSGSLRLEGGEWVTTSKFTPSVPASLRDSVLTRLRSFDTAARRVINAAALLGRRFDWELLPGIAQVDGATVVATLRDAADEQLIEADGNAFRFRHALTREVVLDDLLPTERRDLAARAWPAVENAHPGLEGSVCELAAELAEAAGQPAAAATLLLVSARRALTSSALSSAEAITRRAREMGDGDAAVELAADEALVAVLVAAGKAAAALQIGEDVARRLDGDGANVERRVDLLVTLARAAISAGRPAIASNHATTARTLTESIPDGRRQVLDARIDAVAAHAALDRGSLDEADALARRAVGAAAATMQPEVECEALEVLGRVTSDFDESIRWFERGAAVAVAHALPRWHLRAQQELALLSWSAGRTEPLKETRALATRYGALTTVAVMDLSLADIALSAFDREGCLRAAQSCVEASVRYGLATESVAQLWMAGGHALDGNDDAMNASIAAALARDPGDPRILGDLYGRVLATRAFVGDDLGTLRTLLDTMMEHVRRAPPTTSIFPGRIFWAAIHTIEDDDLGTGQRHELVEASHRVGVALFSLAIEVVEGVALGRQGESRDATERVSRALHEMRGAPMGGGLVRCQQMLIAPAAHRDGWGHPEEWLRESEAFFAAGGFEATARRCRMMLRDMGARVPRRGRGDSVVPAPLRALGVTSREMDVLACLVDGLSNREIAERLFLSTKTVDRHLSSLFDRTGLRSRHALADLADRADHAIDS